MYIHVHVQYLHACTWYARTLTKSESELIHEGRGEGGADYTVNVQIVWYKPCKGVACLVVVGCDLFEPPVGMETSVKEV